MVALGSTLEEAFYYIHNLVTACEIQVSHTELPVGDQDIFQLSVRGWGDDGDQLHHRQKDDVFSYPRFYCPSVFSIPPEVFLSLLSPHVCPEGAHTGQCWRARQCGDAGPGEVQGSPTGPRASW